MNFQNRSGLVGFLLVISALSVPATAQATGDRPATVEARLSRLSAAVRERAEQLPESAEDPTLQALGWGDGRGGTWVNSRAGGWADGRGGAFGNARPWRNGWADGGSFWNSRPGWVNGGSFANRSGGGGFINRR
ncbi:GrrA/OscA1 family cyclophane-containing rSAM-modified RiPP [Pannus brasiliensis CCIBt3594]|uniref:GrrA/OscA1 family cyclophane-containing rSAM-modified RiPP n=1 Tax=Pannus brasiliensis CCIBt3594 TaxID=1427578 RepID=A0AAW9QXL7_9CHRO